MQRAEVDQKQSLSAPLSWDWEGMQKAGSGSGCFSWPCPLARPSVGNAPQGWSEAGKAPVECHREDPGAGVFPTEGTQHRTTQPWSLAMVLGGQRGALTNPGTKKNYGCRGAGELGGR